MTHTPRNRQEHAVTSSEAHRRQQDRAQVRAIIRQWAAEEGIDCPQFGSIPLPVMAAWDAGDQFRVEYGISVSGADPVEDDIYDDYEDIADRVWTGGATHERLMVRTVTPWQEVR